MSRQVAIVGGGLAGLTCAKSLVDEGFSVSVWEGLPFLGGRASTFRDRDGDWVEQGLHLFLGTYSEFKKLLSEIGQSPDEVLFWMSEVRLQDPLGPEATYGTNPLSAPFKTFLSILGQNDFLGPLDKASMVPLSAPALKSFSSLAEYDQQTVKDWWQKVRGTEDVLERFLRPFCRAIQFTDVEEFSAYNFLGWLHHVAYNLPQSLLGGYRGARDEWIFQPLGRYLTDRGATIRTGLRLSHIDYNPEADRIEGFRMEDGNRVEAESYVCALPAWALAPLIPAPLRGTPFFSRIESLPVAPAISVQIWFDRRVIHTPDFILVARTPVPVYQDQSTNAYPYDGGSRISVNLAPADEYLNHSDEELVRLTLEELGRAQPAILTANVVKSVVLKHEKHLIRPLPGAMSARPPQSTPVPNLFLAGDWTQQDYFGSQEGAVRSGRACAAEICRARAG